MSSYDVAVAAGRPARKDPLASLKMAQIMTSKPVLPAETIVVIVDYLAVPDLLRFARVSRRLQEMVYDDARWIKRLKKMGLWNEAEARRNAESSHLAALNTTPGRRLTILKNNKANDTGRPPPAAEIIADADGNARSPAVSSAPQRRLPLKTTPATPRGSDHGFDATSFSTSMGPSPGRPRDHVLALTVMQRVRSVRGQSRHEYGKIYRELGRFYDDAVESRSPLECLVFKEYTTQEDQAQMLAQLRVFSNSDFAPGAGSRNNRLAIVISTFDAAALLEFGKGYEYGDIEGSMRKYARVLYILNGGQSSVDLFLHQNRLILQRARLGSASDCIDYSSGRGHISLQRTQAFFDHLSMLYSEESAVIYRTFREPTKVALLLSAEVGQKILSPFITALCDEAHIRGTDTYLQIVSAVFAQSYQCIQEQVLRTEMVEQEQNQIGKVMTNLFEPHLDLYLTEELAFFRLKSEGEVNEWDQALSEQAASTETFLMSNLNRQADKKDFISSFKKAVMMPVNILPSFPASSSKKSTARAPRESLSSALPNDSQTANRTSTPVLSSNPVSSNTPARSSTPLPTEAPTTELAAKAALMTTKLDNIRGLCSIEVALNLVHAAKASLERVAQFMSLGGPPGEAARSQCQAIFVVLLQILGIRHVKAGFDKAVEHLSAYNPREANTSNEPMETTARPWRNSHDATSGNKAVNQISPLSTFLELVNVGDLIQQMLDVFYETELIRLRISNRDDFLDPAVKEKKKFESMLDERVAAGLGRGIDVLMDEVEYICGTMQRATDFNPHPGHDADIGPTATAKKVVAVVGGHTSMLTGSTDKTLLDVFSTEVGLRLFTTLSKQLKRQRISTTGALPLLSDLSYYAAYIATFKNDDLDSYFGALREVAQLFLIEVKGKQGAEEMAALIADGERYKGVFTVEEVVEWAARRSDWVEGGVKGRVERAMYGHGCLVM